MAGFWSKDRLCNSTEFMEHVWSLAIKMSFKTHTDNPIYHKRHQKIPSERCKRRSKSVQDNNWVIASNDEVILKSPINKSLNYRSKNWKKYSEITEKLYSRCEYCLQIPLLPKSTTKNQPTKRWTFLFILCTANYELK